MAASSSSTAATTHHLAPVCGASRPVVPSSREGSPANAPRGTVDLVPKKKKRKRKNKKNEKLAGADEPAAEQHQQKQQQQGAINMSPTSPARVEDEAVRDLKKCIDKTFSRGPHQRAARSGSEPDLRRERLRTAGGIAQPGGFRRHFILARDRAHAAERDHDHQRAPSSYLASSSTATMNKTHEQHRGRAQSSNVSLKARVEQHQTQTPTTSVQPEQEPRDKRKRSAIKSKKVLPASPGGRGEPVLDIGLGNTNSRKENVDEAVEMPAATPAPAGDSMAYQQRGDRDLRRREDHEMLARQVSCELPSFSPVGSSSFLYGASSCTTSDYRNLLGSASVETATAPDHVASLLPNKMRRGVFFSRVESASAAVPNVMDSKVDPAFESAPPDNFEPRRGEKMDQQDSLDLPTSEPADEDVMNNTQNYRLLRLEEYPASISKDYLERHFALSPATGVGVPPSIVPIQHQQPTSGPGLSASDPDSSADSSPVLVLADCATVVGGVGTQRPQQHLQPAASARGGSPSPARKRCTTHEFTPHDPRVQNGEQLQKPQETTAVPLPSASDTGGRHERENQNLPGDSSKRTDTSEQHQELDLDHLPRKNLLHRQHPPTAPPPRVPARKADRNHLRDDDRRASGRARAAGAAPATAVVTKHAKAKPKEPKPNYSYARIPLLRQLFDPRLQFPGMWNPEEDDDSPSLSSSPGESEVDVEDVKTAAAPSGRRRSVGAEAYSEDQDVESESDLMSPSTSGTSSEDEQDDHADPEKKYHADQDPENAGAEGSGGDGFVGHPHAELEPLVERRRSDDVDKEDGHRQRRSGRRSRSSVVRRERRKRSSAEWRDYDDLVAHEERRSRACSPDHATTTRRRHHSKKSSVALEQRDGAKLSHAADDHHSKCGKTPLKHVSGAATLTTAFILSKSMIGTTLFTLSKPLGKASIVAGSCVYFFVAFLCGWCALCLIKARNAHHDRLVAEGKPREQIKELLTFEGLAGQATGGAWGKTVFSFFLLASEVSFVIACSIAAASSVADVTAGFLPDTFGALSRAQLLLILMTLLLIPQCWVRKIKYFVYNSFIGAVVTLFSVFWVLGFNAVALARAGAEGSAAGLSGAGSGSLSPLLEYGVGVDVAVAGEDVGIGKSTMKAEQLTAGAAAIAAEVGPREVAGSINEFALMAGKHTGEEVPHPPAGPAAVAGVEQPKLGRERHTKRRDERHKPDSDKERHKGHKDKRRWKNVSSASVKGDADDQDSRKRFLAPRPSSARTASGATSGSRSQPLAAREQVVAQEHQFALDAKTKPLSDSNLDHDARAGAAASSRPTTSTPSSAPPPRTTQKIEINWYVPEDSGMSLVSIAGMSLYTAEYVNTILPIYEAHENKQNFTWLFVLCTSGVALLGWALSLTAYLNNPDSESTYCTHDLPPGAMKLVVQSCVTLGCFLTVPILFFVIPHFYEKTVFNKWLQMDNEYILAKLQEEETVKIDAGPGVAGEDDRREVVDTNVDNVQRRARGAEEKISTGLPSPMDENHDENHSSEVVLQRKKTLRKWCKNGARSFLLILMIGLAMLLGEQNVRTLCAVVGGVACAPLAFIFPMLIYQKLGNEITKLATVCNWLVIGFGVCAGIMCTYLAFANPGAGH